jgi:pumilio RNA-binding family
MVFDEILPHLNLLMQDLFGNYVLQKILDKGCQSQRAAIIDQVIGNVVALIKSKYGCRVIQKAFELAHSD